MRAKGNQTSDGLYHLGLEEKMIPFTSASDGSRPVYSADLVRLTTENGKPVVTCFHKGKDR